VHVLNRQVEEITSGAISRRMMMTGLSVGVASAAALSIIRVLTGLSIGWFLVPGYALALIMTFFAPRVFTAIAFDSGGVAAGTMTAAFLLPFAVGACKATGGNVMMDAFGVVGMVAMMPLITVQAMGVLYQRKLSRNRLLEQQEQLAQQAELGEEEASEPAVDGESSEIETLPVLPEPAVDTNEAKAEEPAEPEPPVEIEEPVETEPPVEAEEPAGDEEPVETEQPVGDAPTDATPAGGGGCS
jgi:hypothetical protein